MTGFDLGMVVAGAVLAGTVVTAIIGVLIDRAAARSERTEGR